MTMSGSLRAIRKNGSNSYRALSKKQIFRSLTPYDSTSSEKSVSSTERSLWLSFERIVTRIAPADRQDFYTKLHL